LKTRWLRIDTDIEGEHRSRWRFGDRYGYRYGYRYRYRIRYQ